MKKIILTTILLLFSFTILFSQEEKPGTIELTLNDCIRNALEKNFDISVQAFYPEISETSIRVSKERFMPQFSLDYSNYNYNRLSNWFMEGTQYRDKRNEYSIGIRQDLITGGNINLSLANSTTDSTRSFLSVNPTYSSNLQIRLNQPLLKDFGPKINKRDIKKAQNQRDISVYNLKTIIIQKVFEVEQTYWNLVNSIESLKVNEYSLEHSKKQLKMTKEAARIGTKTGVDVLDSETNVASWESSIITSRAQVERAEEALRQIMNLPADPIGISIPIIPLDKPLVEKREITFEQAMKIAYEERPEMTRNQKEIETSSIDVSYYRNQLLPQLDLEFLIWFPGQSGDRLIYLDDNPYTDEVVDKVLGSRADALKDVFGMKYDNWYIRLNLNLPLQNFISRASLARARLEKEQKLLEMEKLKKSIYHELTDIFKELRNNEKRMEASSRYRELMEKKFKAIEEKYRIGATTSDWVFRYQQDLASAKTSEIRAIIDYKLSVAELEKLLGINLKAKNLKFKDYDF